MQRYPSSQWHSYVRRVSNCRSYYFQGNHGGNGRFFPAVIHHPHRTQYLKSSSKSSSTLGQTFSTPAYTDPALEWGRQNPQVAQACLAIPPLPKSSCTPPLSLLSMTRLEDYYQWRNWKFPVSTTEDKQLAHALVSHVLSAPLTCALFYAHLTRQQKQRPQPLEARHHWCCVGARAEATLPLEFWNELLVAICHDSHDDDHKNATNSNTEHEPLDITIDFVGPDIYPQMLSQSLTYQHLTLHLNWLYKGYLHDYVKKAEEKHHHHDKWNGFVLLNPGLGHPNLREGWKPTLDYLFRRDVSIGHEQHPILLTAHSELDAQRDWNVLVSSQYCNDNGNFPTCQNPFASRITYEDPFDASHVVQPNHSHLMLFGSHDGASDK